MLSRVLLLVLALVPTLARAFASIVACFPQCDAPGWYQYFAWYPHAYWAILGIGSIFHDGEIYMILVSYGYLEEQLIWTVVSSWFDFSIQRQIVSPQLTLELELCGSLVGIVLFHMVAYWDGWSDVASKKTLLFMGIVTPLVLADNAVRYDHHDVRTYVLFYLLGLANGLRRAYHIRVFLFDRYALVMTALWGTPFLSVTDTVLVRTRRLRVNRRLFRRLHVARERERTSLVEDSRARCCSGSGTAHKSSISKHEALLDGYLHTDEFARVLAKDVWIDRDA